MTCTEQQALHRNVYNGFNIHTVDAQINACISTCLVPLHQTYKCSFPYTHVHMMGPPSRWKSSCLPSYIMHTIAILDQIWSVQWHVHGITNWMAIAITWHKTNTSVGYPLMMRHTAALTYPCCFPDYSSLQHPQPIINQLSNILLTLDSSIYQLSYLFKNTLFRCHHFTFKTILHLSSLFSANTFYNISLSILSAVIYSGIFASH